MIAKVRENKNIVGYKSRLARAMKAPSSFLSQVLHGPVHLSMDHAFRISQFWNFTETEREYFMDLVQLSRAGSAEYQNSLKRGLDEKREKIKDLSQRFQQPRIRESDLQWNYYSNWYFGAIHMLLTIPRFQRAEKISEKTRISLPNVIQILETLESAGLVEKKGESWQVTKKSIHLSKDSPASRMNHMLWRQKAIQALEAPWREDFHYTALHTISRKDLERVRSILIQTIEEIRQVVEPSAEEELVCLCCDWFPVLD